MKHGESRRLSEIIKEVRHLMQEKQQRSALERFIYKNKTRKPRTEPKGWRDVGGWHNASSG